MTITYFCVSWDIQDKRGCNRHYSRDFLTENNATLFAIRKQREGAGLQFLEVRKMRRDDNAPFVDEYGKYHSGGGLHLELLECVMTYRKK